MPRLLLLALLSLVMATVYGCGGNTATEETTTSSTQKNAAPAGKQFETPEDVFAAFAEAVKNQDYKTFASLLTADSQTQIAGSFIIAAGLMTLDDENKEVLEELLGRHGIDMNAEEEPTDDPENSTWEATMKVMAAPIEDLPAFIGEMGAWIAMNRDDGIGEFFPEINELGKITIDGNSAKAVYETGIGPRPIEFRKVNGSWLMHLLFGLRPDLDDDGTPVAPGGRERP